MQFSIEFNLSGVGEFSPEIQKKSCNIKIKKKGEYFHESKGLTIKWKPKKWHH